MKRGSRVTLQQVADHAGVSRATASLIVRGSRLVAEPTRKKVEASMLQLGYVYDRVAANLRTRKSSTIGMVINEIGNPFYSELLLAMQEELDAWGYSVLLGSSFESTDKQDQLLSTMLEYRVGGVILSPVGGTSKEFIERFRKWDIPVVLATREPPDSTADYVGIDNVYGATIAVEHLIGKGHRRIAFLGGGPIDSSARIARKQGYTQALHKAGLDYDDSLVINSAATRKGGLEGLRRLLGMPDRPTAIFCYNDIVAIGAMQGLREANLIPGRDVAVVGYDDIEEAADATPPLTTISAPAKLIGSHAASLLHQRILSRTGVTDQPKRIIINPALVVRESCSSSHTIAETQGS